MTEEGNAPARIIRCPICRKTTRYDATNPDRPFCSNRCRTMDIAQWADEGYRVPVKPENSDSDREVKRHVDDEDDDY